MTKLRLSFLEKFGAMSGWLPSMPVSMMPTSTPLAALLAVGAVDSGTDHLHVPLQVCERLGLVVAFAIIAVVRAGLVDGGQGGGNIGSSRIGLGGATDDAIARHADDGR